MTEKLTRQQAIAAGSATYDGTLCRSNDDHGTRRYTTSGGCCVCVKESSRASKAAIRAKRDEAWLRRNLPASLGVTCGR